MVFKSRKGYYQLLVDFKLAFNLEKFEEFYIEECLDKYPFIVGDLSDGALRLKGFSDNERNTNYYKNINKYIEESCAFEAPYYILKRISSDSEFEKLENLKVKAESTETVKHLTLTKENFDKETLVLESSIKNKPRIILDLERINKVPMGSLPSDLRDDSEVEEKVTTSISASEGFVPKERPRMNFDKKRNFNRNRRREG